MRSRADDCSNRSGEAVKWPTRRSPGRAARRRRRHAPAGFVALWCCRALPNRTCPGGPASRFLPASGHIRRVERRGDADPSPGGGRGRGRGGHMRETRLSSHIRPLLLSAPSESVCRGGGALFAAAATCGGWAPRQTLPPVSTQMSAGLRARRNVAALAIYFPSSKLWQPPSQRLQAVQRAPDCHTEDSQPANSYNVTRASY